MSMLIDDLERLQRLLRRATPPAPRACQWLPVGEVYLIADPADVSPPTLAYHPRARDGSPSALERHLNPVPLESRYTLGAREARLTFRRRERRNRPRR
jgi:hypothetical protein